MLQHGLRGALVLGALAFVIACEDGGSPGGGGQGEGAGSGAGGSSGTTTPGAGLPCDVDAILQANCRECHASPPVFGAPMPMIDRAHLLAAPPTLPHATVGEAMIEKINASSEAMPPPPNMPLSDADKATLAAYVDAGMPESNEDCGGQGGGGAGGGYALDCTPDVVLTPSAPFEMPADQTDLYVCFGVEAPSDVARHITAIAPNIDNETILHHILLLQAPNAVSANGEPCDFVNTEWKLVYAWGPGTPPLVLPEEAGFPVGPSEPGHFVIQVHYNNITGLVGETDQSGVSLCTTTELRQHDADIVAFGGTNFDPIQPNMETTVECSSDVLGVLDSYFPITIFQAWPHMHQLGRQFESVIDKADGSQIVLADVPNYDFEYQIAYPVTAELDVNDTVRTRCTWQNTTGSPANFGEDTADEMCFNFVAYYPRIALPQWNWLVPAYAASCQNL